MTNSNLFKPFGVGFCRASALFDEIESRVDQYKYPPHNIIETKTDFIIELACAGFCKDDLRVTAEGKVITVSGKKTKKNQEDGLVYQYHGISSKDFIKKFIYEGQSRISKVSYNDGILKITLMKILPEEEKLKELTIE